MKKLQQGFTLIELMIVVAIIGILAAIALPAYQDYVARSQVSEALTLASAGRTAVSEFKVNNGAWPASNAEAGMEAATDIKGKYVAEVSVLSATGGVIQATMQSGAPVSQVVQGKTVILSAVSNVGSIDWVCKSGGADAVAPKYLPSSCRRS